MGKLEKQSASPPPGQIRHDDHSIGTLNVSSYDTHGTPTTADDEMFFGDGNRPTNYNISVDSKTHIELGLKIHYRQGDDILPVSVQSDARPTTKFRLGHKSSIRRTASVRQIRPVQHGISISR